MKIAQITLPLHTNYGGILQAFALQRVLRDAGHEVSLVRFAPTAFYRLTHSTSVWLKQRGLMPYSHNYPLTGKEKKFIRTNTDQFINDRIRMTEPMSGKTLREAGFDAYVVGSDQVWREFDSRYFLGFLPENSSARRIIYAASFGIDTWPFSPSETDKATAMAARFDAVSVREESAVSLCAENLRISAEQACDPTLLLPRGTYEKFASKECFPSKDAKAMVYILDETPEKTAVVDRVCAELSLKANRVMADKLPSRKTPIEDCIYPSVKKWLSGFLTADYVVTDSFHGVVFALIFNKPFIALLNDKRGATRFTTIINKFGLGDRLIRPGEALTAEQIRMPMDFDHINAVIESERNKGLDFLTRNLK